MKKRKPTSIKERQRRAYQRDKAYLKVLQGDVQAGDMRVLEDLAKRGLGPLANPDQPWPSTNPDPR